MKIVKGDNATRFSYTFKKANKSAFSLAGLGPADFETHFIRLPNREHRLGNGTHEVDNASQGTAFYDVSPEDVAEAGQFEMYTVLLLSGKRQHFISHFVEIEDLP